MLSVLRRTPPTMPESAVCMASTPRISAAVSSRPSTRTGSLRSWPAMRSVVRTAYASGARMERMFTAV